jgi:hypothetical protein
MTVAAIVGLGFYVVNFIYGVAVLVLVSGLKYEDTDYRDVLWNNPCKLMYYVALWAQLFWCIGAPWRCGVEYRMRCWRAPDECGATIVSVGIFATGGQWAAVVFMLLLGVWGRYWIDRDCETTIENLRTAPDADNPYRQGPYNSVAY